MIKATDLRLYNCLLDKGQFCQVERIEPEAITVLHWNSSELAILQPDQLEGLPLTPELLQQSGFVAKDDSNEYKFLLDEEAVITVNPYITGGYSVQLCVKGSWCGKPVSFFHELQNMYLDLTGEEQKIDWVKINVSKSLHDFEH